MAKKEGPKMIIEISPDGKYTVKDQDGNEYNPVKWRSMPLKELASQRLFVFYTTVENPTCYMNLHDGLCNSVKIPYPC
jgi:hypothetical protein